MGKDTKIYLVSNCYGDINKVYVGKTINSSRKNDHKRKYGYNIKFKILEEIKGTNKELWKPRESYWIQHYTNLGYEVLNKQKSGGSGVEYHSIETKSKIKKWRKENRVRIRKDVEEQKDLIIEKYKSGSGPHVLGREFNCHPDVIKRILRENNIEFRSPSESQKCRKGERRRKDLWGRIDEIKLLYSQGKNYTELGRIFNTSDVQIKNMLNK
tara:strand:- start:7 stop:642 length:636 start_codon:yes stop_codon:yes gene_type:complete